jgi:hypothetical protein
MPLMQINDSGGRSMHDTPLTRDPRRRASRDHEGSASRVSSAVTSTALREEAVGAVA